MEKNNKNKNILKEVESILRNIPKVENMIGYTGRKIQNQFIIYGNGFKLFQSYNSPIAMLKGDKVYIFRDWDYSTTTGKYRNMFLNETKQETLKKLKSGEYTAVDFGVE